MIERRSEGVFEMAGARLRRVRGWEARFKSALGLLIFFLRAFREKELVVEQYSDTPSEPVVVVCAECGGEAVAGLNRMCPVCRSRNTEIMKVEPYLD
jgi:hypothetical protein